MTFHEDLQAVEKLEFDDFSLEQRAMEDVRVIAAGREAQRWEMAVNARKKLLISDEENEKLIELDKLIPHVMNTPVNASGYARLVMADNSLTEPQKIEGLMGEFRGFYANVVPEGVKLSYGIAAFVDMSTVKILTPTELALFEGDKRTLRQSVCMVDINGAVLDFSTIHPDRARAILELFLPPEKYHDLIERAEFISDDPVTSLDDAARYLGGFYVDDDTLEINDGLVRRSMQVFIDSITTIDVGVPYIVRYGDKSFQVYTTPGYAPRYVQQAHKQVKDGLITASGITAKDYIESIDGTRKKVVRFALLGVEHETESGKWVSNKCWCRSRVSSPLAQPEKWSQMPSRELAKQIEICYNLPKALFSMAKNKLRK